MFSKIALRFFKALVHHKLSRSRQFSAAVNGALPEMVGRACFTITVLGLHLASSCVQMYFCLALPAFEFIRLCYLARMDIKALAHPSF